MTGTDDRHREVEAPGDPRRETAAGGRTGERMLIDKYLPAFEVREHHEVLVRAEVERAYAALRALDLMRSRLVRLLFAIRTLPERFGGRAAPAAAKPASRPFLELALDIGWKVLEEAPDRELVAGAITQPWNPVVEFRGLPGSEFVSFREPGFAKIAWNIAARPAGGGRTLLSTETRVATTDAASRRKFKRYWLVFSPGIRLIRRAALGLVQRDLEAPAPRRAHRPATS
jgi:hypothetical protein